MRKRSKSKKAENSRAKFKTLVVVVSAILFGSYLVMANWFLNSSKFRSLLDSWDDGILVYSWIFSPLPGVAYVSRPGVTHQDRHVRWTLNTGYAFIVFSPISLLRHKVRFYQISIGETVFHFVERKHVDGNRRRDSLSAAYYPVVKFTKPEIKRDSKKSTGPKWSVHMTNVSVSAVKDAWVNEYHYTGSIGITGGFRIIPDVSVTVFPAVVRFSPGVFLLGEKKIAQALEGEIRYRMEPFDPDAPDPEIYRSISLRADLRAEAQSLDPLNIYFASLPWFRLDEGAGSLRANIGVESGRVVAPGSVHFETHALRVQLGKFVAQGAASLHWQLVSGSPAMGVFEGTIHGAEIGYKAKAPFLSAGALTLSGKSADLGFDKLFESLALELRLKAAKAPDLRKLNALLPPQSPLRFESGAAHLDIELKTDSSALASDTGHIHIDAPEAGVVIKPQQLVGKLKVRLPFQQSRAARGELNFRDGQVSLLDATLKSNQDQATSSWWAQVKIPHARFVAEPTKMSADFEVLMRNSLPLVPLLTGVNRGETLLTQVVTVENIRCGGKFSVAPWGFELTGLNFDSSGLKVRGFYTEKDDVAFARMLFVVDPFAVGLYIAQSQTRLILNDAFNWYKNAPSTAAEIATEPVTK